jgi:hypothetical protein
MMVVNREILVTPGPQGPQTEAVFDLSSTHIAAAAAALAHYRRTRFAGAALDTDEVLELRALTVLAEQVDDLAAAEGHAAVRTDRGGVCALVEAVLIYVRERDVEGYQSPEERERIGALRELADPLIELACELRRAERGNVPASV